MQMQMQMKTKPKPISMAMVGADDEAHSLPFSFDHLNSFSKKLWRFASCFDTAFSSLLSLIGLCVLVSRIRISHMDHVYTTCFNTIRYVSCFDLVWAAVYHGLRSL